MRPFLAVGLLLLGLAAFAQTKDEVLQCANLVYGGDHSSRCFSDEFLSAVQKSSTIRTERRFKSVKLDSDELFKYPFAMITGESDFYLSAKERGNLKKYLGSGGFLLASAGCSSKGFDQAFRREFKRAFPDAKLQDIPLSHPIFHTVNKVEKLKTRHPAEGKSGLQGLERDGKLVLVYSPQGLNDTAHSTGCCCCGGNEIENSIEINMNILVYALLH